MKDLNFSRGFVKSGSKNVSEAAPKLTLTSTYSNFKLNNKAMEALNVLPGERVAMFDMRGDVKSQDDRYYICKADFKVDGVEQGALISTTRNFRYSGIYNTMLNNDIEVSGLSTSDLIAKELLSKRSAVHVALQTGSADLVAINDGKPIEVADGVERVLFGVKNIVFEAHTPKSIGGKDEPGEYSDTTSD